MTAKSTFLILFVFAYLGQTLGCAAIIAAEGELAVILPYVFGFGFVVFVPLAILWSIVLRWVIAGSQGAIVAWTFGLGLPTTGGALFLMRYLNESLTPKDVVWSSLATLLVVGAIVICCKQLSPPQTDRGDE